MTWTSSQISVALSCKLSQFVHINPQFHNYINTEMILWNVSQQPHFMPPWRKNQPKDEAAYIHFIDLNIKFCDSCFCASHMRINSKLQIVTVFPSTIVCASHNLWPPQKCFAPSLQRNFAFPQKFSSPPVYPLLIVAYLVLVLTIYSYVMPSIRMNPHRITRTCTATPNLHA